MTEFSKSYQRPFKVFIDRDLFLEEHGYDLNNRLQLDDGGTIAGSVDRFLIDVCRSVHTWIIANCHSINPKVFYDENMPYIGSQPFEKLVEFTREAQLIHALYVLENGNLDSVAIKEFKEVAVPYSDAFKELFKADGLTFAGL